MEDETGRRMVKTESEHEKLKDGVNKGVRRIKQSEQERPTLFAQTVYLGALGLMFVLPVVGGAYLGRWLDNRFTGYSFSWTVSLIVVGVFVGALNVYLFIRE